MRVDSRGSAIQSRLGALNQFFLLYHDGNTFRDHPSKSNSKAAELLTDSGHKFPSGTLFPPTSQSHPQMRRMKMI